VPEPYIHTAIREHVARLANRTPLMDDYAEDLEEIEDTLTALVEANDEEF